MVADGLTLPGRRGPVAVRTQFPAARRGVERGFEHIVELSGQLRILDLSHHLDSSVEITMHHVRAPYPELVDGAEVNNSRVFQKPAQNRANRDVLGKPGGPGFERADAAHHDIDPYTG